jgi:hypothetical protein
MSWGLFDRQPSDLGGDVFERWNGGEIHGVRIGVETPSAVSNLVIFAITFGFQTFWHLHTIKIIQLEDLPHVGKEISSRDDRARFRC